MSNEKDSDPLPESNAFPIESLSVAARPETVEEIVKAVKKLVAMHENPGTGHIRTRQATVGVHESLMHLIENKWPSLDDPYVVDFSISPIIVNTGEYKELVQGTFFVERGEDGQDVLKSYPHSDSPEDEMDAVEPFCVDEALARYVLDVYLNGSSQS